MTKKKILIATGGTGGHIFPALSLAKNLIKKNYDIILTTDKRGLKYLNEINEINLKKITSSPLVKKNIFRLIFSVLLICYSTVKSFFLLSFNRPHIVIGMGGYSSFPVCVAAIQTWNEEYPPIPIIICGLFKESRKRDFTVE